MAGPTFADDLNLADYFLFDRIKEGHGSRIALRFGDHTVTYDEVALRTRKTAHVFLANGLPRGGRVLIILRDIPAFAWVFFATLAAGGVVVMGNPDAPFDSLEYLVEYTRASIVVAPPRIATPLRASMDARGVEAWFIPVDEPATGEDPRRTSGESGDLETAISKLTESELSPLPKLHRDEPCIWLFTSGSTGKPKAAMHTHRDFAYNTEVFAKATVGVHPDDITVSIPRLFFGYATGTNLMFPFAVGASVGMFAERPTPESLIDAIQRYRPTVLTMVPTMMGKLLEFDETAKSRGEPGLDLSTVRFSYSAGEALPGPLLNRWLERFNSEVYDGIGSAEMFHIYASNRPGDVKPGSLGRAVNGYELRILAEDATGAGAPELPVGEIGVLWVKGDSVAQGYWLDRDKSWSTFHGHWCRTGDLFHLDAEGYLYFDGRSDDLLKVSGIFVSPLEVEDCLLTHPAIASVAVIGCDDAGLIKPKAFVVLRESALARASSLEARNELRAEIKAHVKDHLAKHKYPRWVVFTDELPKNDRGKVDRKLLRGEAWQQRGEE